jgi:meiosis-specific transcription factor NDT80
MDPTYGPKPGNSFPPLGDINTIGHLQYIADSGSITPIKCDINGAIDKGFFLADNEWTCYRRNYFSCTCSFSLSPTQYPGSQIQYVCDGNVWQVRNFLMSISATVADDGKQSIELVQHTPKRDKGPTAKPDRVPLAARQPMSHQSLGTSLYHSHDHNPLVGPGRGVYDPTTVFPNSQQGPNNFPTEHTFERIQFKQATANNGKRRAAQQYYHLCIELWAECSNHPDQCVKVATKQSAKMIVRGRSPGHYSDNRRNSTSNGPGGSAGSLSGFPNGMLGQDFPPSAGLPGSSFGGPYEPRGGPPAPPGLHYNPMRGPRDIPPEAYVSPEDDKSIHMTKEYQYYPGTIYEGQQDSRHGIAMFTHPTHRTNDHSMMSGTMGASFDSHSARVKNESEGGIGAGHGGGMLPSIFSPGPGVSTRRCQPFEGKHTSSPYYPTMMPQIGLSMSNIT